jgi:hypothetical protein
MSHRPFLLAAFAFFSGCAEPAAAPPPRQPEVPIGLAHEVPIEEDKAPKHVDEPDDDHPAPATTATAAPTPTPVPVPAKGPKVSKAECQQLFKHYTALVVASTPGLSGIPQEVIDQATAQTDTKAGGNPCNDEAQRPTKAQGACAKAAKTKDAWEACLK